jgi:plastocyanin
MPRPFGARLPRILVSGLLAAGCVAQATPRPTAATAVELTVSSAAGHTLAFVPDVLAAPAGVLISVTFRNVSSQSHNLTFQAPISVGSRTIVEAGSSDLVVLTTPTPGRYPFVCTIHEGMTGTLAVE